MFWSKSVIKIMLKKRTKNLSLPPLAVGMGIYLPQDIQLPLVFGAIMGYLLRKHLRKQGDKEMEAGEI